MKDESPPAQVQHALLTSIEAAFQEDELTLLRNGMQRFDLKRLTEADQFVALRLLSLLPENASIDGKGLLVDGNNASGRQLFKDMFDNIPD